MKLSAIFLIGLVLASSVSAADGQVPHAGVDAGPAADTPGCTISKTSPNLSALPSGTRVFLMPVLRIEHVRSEPAPQVVQVRELAGSRDANAEVRDGIVYVRQDQQMLTALDREPVKFGSALEVCAFPPGSMLPGPFATHVPDLITR